ncbi:adaptor Ad4 [Arthrobacter phage Mendel]|uniref:Lower collar protein n=1 Tax=Arthrobacter phage Mendel TaxID=2484218 RepID=A0A3G3M0F7_9CAUD|nr:adaptor Ad4 [Arthrobacter phage Mendel]AYQ99929.1 lower collar protein [Arthrobacter phage Mendel]
MATFTIELRRVLELEPTIQSEVLAEYDIFDEEHRATLNRKIINHFWNREIGQETISLFKLQLKRRLDEIMPLYNQHYEISAIKFNQLETVRVKNAGKLAGTSTSTGDSSTESASGAKSRAVAQEMPQTMLSGTGDYATQAQDNISDTTATGSSTENGSSENSSVSDNVTTGFQGNAALMLLQYRQSLVNVDMMIIEELQNLFMLIWDNGDELAGNGNNYGYYGYWGFPL